ncbi:hypothetical protein D5R93_03960 [Actinomyces lilanjuaniae]|uniref:Geranylgeranyl transferase type II subunit beta n=1 Tax=Actinomyces lilanjuaniae TaxID=2321394 RepID=A0ABN5PMZ9_9ACTO|nr:prenyltransferase/squalene oxidase repeat-containing protein [Actinomyces lilanjuaniae]AYD89424.1 hypothetical protein D5R93_03960 [Actinomyces lilanjuaniae]
MAAETGKPDLQDMARRALERFVVASNDETPPSLLDVTGAIHPLGEAMNGFDTVVWALGALALNNDTRKARSILDKLAAVAWAENFTRTGEVLISERRLATASAGVLLAVRAGSNIPIEAIEMFWDGVQFWDRVDAAGTPVKSLGASTHDLSWALMACRSLASHSEVGNRWLHRAEVIVTMLHNTVIPTAWHPGIWSRLDRNNRVSVLSEAAFARGDFSPFPAVLASDQALLLVALQGFTSNGADILRETARETLSSLHDPTGGVNYGQGSWFSTPTDPTVPLDRLVMVPPRSVSGYSVGNSTYVPTQNKHAYTQICALWAGTAASKEHTAEPPPGQSIQLIDFDARRPPVPRGTTPTPRLNLDAYLNWLERTRSGTGYGLTPYAAPLGFRADTSAQTFSMLHVLSDLTVLGRPLPDAKWISQCLIACRNPDGGFAERPGLPSEVFTTYCAVLSGLIARADFGAVDKTAHFLRSAQQHSGGFGNYPGVVEDIWHTNLAVLALVALHAEPKDSYRLTGFLRSCRNDDGGYGQRPGRISDAFATFRAIGSLLALGAEPEHVPQTITYLNSLQDPGGGFRYRRDATVSFVGSYHAIAGLYVLGMPVPDVDRCRRYILSRQEADGGFGRHANGTSETTDEGFIAVQALHMLNESLDRTWALMLT